MYGSRNPKSGSSGNQQSGGLMNLMDLLKGKGPDIAQGAGSMIPQKGFGNVAGGALSGAGAGAKIGSMIAPGVGTAIGAAVGGIGGALFGGSQWKQQQHEQQIAAIRQLQARHGY